MDIQEKLRPLIERFCNETGLSLKNAKWRHCNDSTMDRSTISFSNGDFRATWCVFEYKMLFSGVSMDVWYGKYKYATNVISHRFKESVEETMERAIRILNWEMEK